MLCVPLPSLQSSRHFGSAADAAPLDREIALASRRLEHMTVGSLPSYSTPFGNTRESMDADEAEYLDNKLMADLANQVGGRERELASLFPRKSCTSFMCPY